MATQTYKNIISNSDLKSKGPPAVYQLRAKKQQFGELTRMTVGKKNLKNTTKTILLVGETGAGKSTLINALINYTMGVKWEDEVWFQIVEEEKSQTSDVIVYEIFGFEDKTLPYSLTIIDTPGYGDTRGINHDDFVIKKLFDLFQLVDGIEKVHAVGLVMKATGGLSDRTRYIFDSMMSLFGKDLEKNTVALITHSNGMPPKGAVKALDGAKVICAKNKKNQLLYFLFNNLDEPRTEENELGLENAWNVTKKGMSQFTAFLEKIQPQQPTAKLEVRECVRLTACIQNLQERIKLTEVKQREVKQTQEALERHEQGMKRNEELTAFFTEVYKDKQYVKGGMCGQGEAAVSCNVCEENCHYPGCTVPLTHCEVFRDGHCISCTGKCSASDHVKEKWRYVTRIRKVQKNKTEVKQDDEKNKTEHVNKLSLLEKLQNQMIKLSTNESMWLEETYHQVVRLEQIALKAHSASAIVHLDFLIEKMKEKGDTEKVQKLEEMRSREDEGTRAALRNRISLILSRYEDIISDSFPICSGPPAVYQLRPKKEKFEELTRMTVGEKNPNGTNKTILLVGETGAGKSTLINALLNYSMGVKWEDEVWFQIVEEEEKKKSQAQGQTESQTSDVIVYEIFGFEDETLPYSLTIIDTPGFGDTRGIKHDDISERLFDLFRSEDGIHEVHAVGLVMKATDNRLSDRLMYVFDSMMTVFGKDLEKNIVALMTHSNGKMPDNALGALKAANIKCSRNEKNQPVYFLFDNCQHQGRTEENTASKHKWEFTQKSLDHLTKFLEISRPQKVLKTIEVINERIRLKACIQNLKERIEFIEKKRRKLSKFKRL